MKPSTDALNDLLAFLESYAAEHGYAPTVREIQAGLGIASPATVHRRLLALDRAGLIDRIPGTSRTIRVVG